MTGQPQAIDPTPSRATVADRLRHARTRRFVGRAAELELLRGALAADEPPFSVLFIHGMGGVGKTALLGAMAEVAQQAGVRPVRLDMRALEPSPPALLDAIRSAVGSAPGAPVEPALAREPHVLLIDTYESAAPLDRWLREQFLPGLPAGTLVVIAGREPPAAEWLSDPGWQDLLRVVGLRNLHPDDARAYLRAAGVAEGLHDNVVAATHGHPLALVLHVDLLARDGDGAPGTAPVLSGAPDLVRRLLERFVHAVPSGRHRRALEVSAHARVTTEDLLQAVLGGGDAGELFSWLTTLPFVEHGPRGLFPHDLVRDALLADLRWRDPHSYRELHQGVRQHVLARLGETAGHDWELAADMVFLHQTNPFTAAFWDWKSFGSAYIDRPRAGDAGLLRVIAERHEGLESAALVDHWLERQPHAFFVFRTAAGDPIGFAAVLALHEARDEDIAADPGAAAMWTYALRHGAPRPGEGVHAARFLMDRDAYQGPSESFNLITVAHMQHMLRRPEIGAWEFIGPWADPDRIEPMMAYIEFARATEADYEVGGRRYGVFVHDWRRMDLEEFFKVTADRETAGDFDPPASRPADPSVIALSQPEFADAVRGALRDLHRPEALARNPLLRSRVLRDRAGEAPAPQALQDAIDEAAGSLRVHPRDERLHRALTRTYLRPAPTQEAAAELLGVPFSTYRRHLARAVERVTEWLWERELYGPGG